jgi:hypothetical protein
MENSPLQPRQPSVSQPIIQRDLDLLHGGSKAPPIKVDGDVIVDGHHREIAGQIFGEPPARVPGTRPRSVPPRPWNDVEILPIDFDNP